mgnify:CR=1 FL=1
MRIKRLLITTVVSLAMASLIALGFSKWRDSQIKPPPPSVEPLPNSIVVYCLHDYARGPDCRTIEKFVREAIDEALADELAAGKVTLTLANFEHPGNAFLIDQYDVRKPTIVIVDGRRDIATELVDGRFLYLVEHHTKDGAMPNSGVTMLRTGDDCREFLDLVWAQEDLIEHRWWENAAICRLLGYELDPIHPGPPTRWRERTELISGEWNSIRDAPARHARIRHYPGYSLRTRTVFMARDSATATIRRRLGRG